MSIPCAVARWRLASSKGRTMVSMHCPKTPGTTRTRYGDSNDSFTVPGAPAGHRYRAQSPHFPGTCASTPQKRRLNSRLEGSFSILIGSDRRGGDGSTMVGTVRVQDALVASATSAQHAALTVASAFTDSGSIARTRPARLQDDRALYGGRVSSHVRADRVIHVAGAR